MTSATTRAAFETPCLTGGGEYESLTDLDDAPRVTMDVPSIDALLDGSALPGFFDEGLPGMPAG